MFNKLDYWSGTLTLQQAGVGSPFGHSSSKSRDLLIAVKGPAVAQALALNWVPDSVRCRPLLAPRR